MRNTISLVLDTRRVFSDNYDLSCFFFSLSLSLSHSLPPQPDLSFVSYPADSLTHRT